MSLVQDGECLDIVNMRMAGGSLLPMPQPRNIAGLRYAYSAFYHHATARCYIGITAGNERTLHFYDNSFAPIMSGGSMLVIDGLQGVNALDKRNFEADTCGIYYVIHLTELAD